MADRGNSFLTDRLLRHPVFLFCLAMYAGFRLLLWQWPQWLPALVKNHLADLLCLPIILTVVVLIQRHIVLRSPGYRLNKWQVLFAVAYFSVLFELVFPVFYARYTADAWDVAAYALGGVIYWRWINPPAVQLPSFNN